MAHLPHRAIKSRNLAERCWSDLAESGTLCRDNVGGRRGDSALRADFYVAPCVGAIKSGGRDTARRARRQTTASWTVASRKRNFRPIRKYRPIPSSNWRASHLRISFGVSTSCRVRF